MKLTDLKKKQLLCTNCLQMTAMVTEEDNKNNLARLKEQSFREKDQPFKFKFRLTCSTCGTVYFEKTIKNVKINT